MDGIKTIAALSQAIKIADAFHGGHLTIMKFTIGWKVMFGTPELTIAWDKNGLNLDDVDSGYGAVHSLSSFDTLHDALDHAVEGDCS